MIDWRSLFVVCCSSSGRALLPPRVAAGGACLPVLLCCLALFRSGWKSQGSSGRFRSGSTRSRGWCARCTRPTWMSSTSGAPLQPPLLPLFTIFIATAGVGPRVALLLLVHMGCCRCCRCCLRSRAGLVDITSGHTRDRPPTNQPQRCVSATCLYPASRTPRNQARTYHDHLAISEERSDRIHGGYLTRAVHLSLRLGGKNE